MANSSVAMYIQTIESWLAQILPADTTTLKTLITAGAQGSRVNAILATTTDTTTRDVQIWITRSAVNYLIGTINLPITAGFVNNAPTVNLLNNTQIPGVALDSNGNPYLDLKAGDVLAAASTGTVTAAKVIQVVAYGGDF